MMGRWGLEGMRSFQQASMARKEGARLKGDVVASEAALGAEAGRLSESMETAQA